MSFPTATAMIRIYNADPVHSSLGFSISYQGVSVYRGTLRELDAKLVDGHLEGTAPVESRGALAARRAIVLDGELAVGAVDRAFRADASLADPRLRTRLRALVSDLVREAACREAEHDAECRAA